MMKNDKIIVVVGVAVIIFAAIGIYYWVPQEAQAQSITSHDFLDITGNLKDMPGSITVADSCPFYPLIATPLAVNYDENGQQAVIPMYVMNFTSPSTAITRLQDQLQNNKEPEIIPENETPEHASLRIAQTYWDSSEAAVIIEYSESGYMLGVPVTPLASYLRIPVIVAEDLNSDVVSVLTDLGVKKTIVCGDSIKGYGSYVRFNTPEEVVNASIIVVELLSAVQMAFSLSAGG